MQDCKGQTAHNHFTRVVAEYACQTTGCDNLHGRRYHVRRGQDGIPAQSRVFNQWLLRSRHPVPVGWNLRAQLIKVSRSVSLHM